MGCTQIALDRSNPITAVDVYLIRRKSREYVGRLFREGKNFVFMYNEAYVYKERSIPLGPDLPLSAKKFVQQSLFPSFEDRIPSKNNPAYKEYCGMVGISPNETDPLTLVAMLGQKGPSSFIFVAVTQNKFNYNDVINFRKYLEVSIREFSDIFDIAFSTVHKIEKNKTSGKDTLKRLEIYAKFPQVALWEVNRNGFKLNDEKKQRVIDLLKKLPVESQ